MPTRCDPRLLRALRKINENPLTRFSSAELHAVAHQLGLVRQHGWKLELTEKGREVVEAMHGVEA